MPACLRPDEGQVSEVTATACGGPIRGPVMVSIGILFPSKPMHASITYSRRLFNGGLREAKQVTEQTLTMAGVPHRAQTDGTSPQRMVRPIRIDLHS